MYNSQFIAMNKKGLLYGFLCYLIWGLFPVYWKLLQHVDSIEILSHRMLWSCVFMVVVFCGFKHMSIRQHVKTAKQWFMLLLTGSLMAFNWGLYIWAINHHYILESSLGYYINPLLNVLLGTLFLKERLNKSQVIAILFALVGVGYFTIDYGRFPIISIALATSFAIYGLLKKKMALAATPALTVETLWMLPLSLLYIVALCGKGESALCDFNIWTYVLLIGAGVVTAVPLLLFGKAAERIPLTTLGFLQYISPTGQFLLGVLLYKEAFTTSHLICFGFIWAGLILFTIDAIRQASKTAK